MHVHLCVCENAFVLLLLLYPTTPAAHSFQFIRLKAKAFTVPPLPSSPPPAPSLTVCNANALKIACGHQLSYTYSIYSTYIYGQTYRIDLLTGARQTKSERKASKQKQKRREYTNNNKCMYVFRYDYVCMYIHYVHRFFHTCLLSIWKL